MARNIRDNYSKNHPLTINRETIRDLRNMCIEYEIRDTHPDALNTDMLGVEPIYFLPQDRERFFSVFKQDEKEFRASIREVPNSSINKNFHVQSDAFNQLAIWAAHNIMVSRNIPAKERDEGLKIIFKLLLYRFFSSLLRHYLKFGADESIMRITVNNLSRRFDIVQYGTWKKDLEARAEDIFDRQSIHYGTLQKYDDDKAINYILSDTQSRLRRKLQTLLDEYYKTKELGDRATTYRLANDIDGEKVLMNMTDSFSSIVDTLFAEVLNTNAFIDVRKVRVIADLFESHIRPDMFRRLLITFSTTASNQYKDGTTEQVKHNRREKMELVVGIKKLVGEIVQKTYRYAIQNNIPTDNQLMFLMRVREVYSSSRVSDEDIIRVKTSVRQFVDGTKLSSRNPTQASLTIGLILYIIILSFEFIDK